MQATTTIRITRRDIAKVMKRFPELNYGGNGHDHPMNLPDQHGITNADRSAHLATMRAWLLEAGPMCSLIANWLQHLEPIKSPSVSSYFLKGLGETATQQYLGNGAMIVAAAYLRFPIEQYHNSPNVAVGVARRSWWPWFQLSQPGAYTPEKAAGLLAASHRTVAGTGRTIAAPVVGSMPLGVCCAACSTR